MRQGGWWMASSLRAMLRIACAGAVLMLPVAAQPVLRVVTYNVHHGAGNDTCAAGLEAQRFGADCGLDLPRIASILQALKPDVVALQEVDRFWKRSGGQDQVREFARLLGMEPCYGANLRLAPEQEGMPGREYGTLTLSRLPISSCRNELLPKAAAAEEQRGLLRTEVDVGGERVVVWNTHLHVRQADRVLQTARVAEMLREERKPQVLVGDLNATPGSPELQPLLGAMRDAWAVRGAGEGLTSPASPTVRARNRIDYILAGARVEVETVAVVADERTAMASDHYPVVASVRIVIP